MNIVVAPPAANEHQEFPLTDEQRAIVEHADGPVVVIAGAGTGKTRVIVERVKWLLETKEDLLPEQILVLTYNVKAARELRSASRRRVGPATKSRLTISNFHSFCHRVLSESAAEADMPPNPDVLDGVGQLLLIRDLRPNLDLVYHGDWAYNDFVKFINRAKDELVTPGRLRRLRDAGASNLRGPIRQLRRCRRPPGHERQPAAGARRAQRVRAAATQRAARNRQGDRVRPNAPEKAADREARRTISGTGEALPRTDSPRSNTPRSTSWPRPTSPTARRSR